jgi:hypothetical protein
MATRQDIRNEGFRRGQNVASWVDMPAIGTELQPDIDWIGLDIVTEANQYEAWEMLCNEAESNDRQSSPFEQTAHELNELAETKPYDPWEVFEDGIRAGIQAYGRRHHKAALANAKQEG